jgi:hypothetical protein
MSNFQSINDEEIEQDELKAKLIIQDQIKKEEK